MSIKFKLIIAFISISLIPIILVSVVLVDNWQSTSKKYIGESFENLAKEKAEAIDFVLKERVNEAAILAGGDNVKNAVISANSEYVGKESENIKVGINKIDEAWIESKLDNTVANTILNNKTSSFLKDYKNRDTEKYGEIFITDKEGAAVAMTSILSDYYQADEEWWASSFNNGAGGNFIDDRGYDASVDSLVLGIVVPVMDNGEAIGVLKINYKVKEILNIIAAVEIGETQESILARSSGDIVFSSNINDDEPLDLMGGLLSGESNYVRSSKNGENIILGYAPVEVDIFTRVSNPGERKGISGEKWEVGKWYVVLALTESEAFAPINEAINLTVIITLVVLLLIIVIAFYISASISGPIIKLTKMADGISKGNLDVGIEKIDRKDEIGSLARAFERMRASVKILMDKEQN